MTYSLAVLLSCVVVVQCLHSMYATTHEDDSKTVSTELVMFSSASILNQVHLNKIDINTTIDTDKEDKARKMADCAYSKVHTAANYLQTGEEIINKYRRDPPQTPEANQEKHAVCKRCGVAKLLHKTDHPCRNDPLDANEAAKLHANMTEAMRRVMNKVIR